MYFSSADEDPFFKNRKDTQMLNRKKRDSVRKYRNKKNRLCLVQSDSHQPKISTVNEKHLVLDSPAPLSFVEENKIGANYQSSSSLSSSSSLNNSFISNYSKESVSSDTDSDKDEQTQDTQMFLNSPTSVEEFINALLPLIFKHRMNDASIKDQLKLLKSTLPSPNNCP
jgi:hypothetical protein